MTVSTLFHPVAASLLSAVTKLPRVEMQPMLAGAARALLAGHEGLRIIIVCDARTHAALGARVVQELAGWNVDALLLPGEPAADEATVLVVREASRDAGLVVAVGGGTISDLCKYASFLDGKDYVVFPTAPSMNGYTSANASITVDGHKRTLRAHLPLGVYCDLGVLRAAPARLVRAGVGDLLARPTAQADWLLSYLMRGTAYDERPFALAAPYEAELLDKAAAVTAGDTGAHALLMKLLLLSGFGMVLAGGSYPASQGEHAIAHAYEEMFGSSAYHGEAIGVTTLYMARLQEQRVDTLPREVAARIRAVMLPPARIEAVLQAMGAPTTPEQLGWDAEKFAEAVKHAPSIRNRFGFLNLID